MSRRPATPPQFVMWRTVPHAPDADWNRSWFGHELDPTTVFAVRGLGLREPMFNADVFRPIGTGDWLIMYFHQAVRLERHQPMPTSPARTLIIWPPGAPQFYSWGACADSEPHTWMHLEGTWVERQVADNRLPVSQPLPLDDATLMTTLVDGLLREMTEHEVPDQVILQNLFQNWARSVGRKLQTRDPERRIPDSVLTVRTYLDQHFAESLSLDRLARLAKLSRSRLCHQFREHLGTTISAYIIRKRMSTAQRLLYDVNLRPGEIGRCVGYADIFQFSKQFKKWFGVSPTRFRQQHSPTRED